jgi:hypothetical protein
MGKGQRKFREVRGDRGCNGNTCASEGKSNMHYGKRTRDEPKTGRGSTSRINKSADRKIHE